MVLINDTYVIKSGEYTELQSAMKKLANDSIWRDVMMPYFKALQNSLLSKLNDEADESNIVRLQEQLKLLNEIITKPIRAITVEAVMKEHNKVTRRNASQWR